MTFIPETDVTHGATAFGCVLRRAVFLAGFVAFVLLLIVGPPPMFGFGPMADRSGAALAVAEAPFVAGMNERQRMGALRVTDLDDVPGAARAVEAVLIAPPRPFRLGFGPVPEAVPPTRASLPPERPPRYV